MARRSPMPSAAISSTMAMFIPAPETTSARPRSVRLALSLRRQVFGGGALENAAVDVEARAVARAVPRAFGGVEREAASEVSARRGDRVEHAGVVPVGGHRIAVDVDDPTFIV